MKKVLEGTPNEFFKEPEIEITEKPILNGELIGRTIKIDKETGSIATENTSEELVEEIFFSEHHCVLYYVDKDDPLGPIPSQPEKDPQFKLWEDRILEWAKKQDESYNPDIINEAENIYDSENTPVFTILSPQNNQTIETNNLVVSLEATAPRGIYKIEYYINNNLLDKKTSYPFDLNKDISFLSNGYYNLKVRVCDDVLNCSEKSIEFNLLLSSSNIKLHANLKLIYPTSGLALSSMDFPLPIKMVSTNPEQIIKINIILDKNIDEEKYVIKTIEPVLNKAIEINWDNPPEKGTYKLYGEFYDWNGSIKKSNQITININ
jgi:hypothetical protein